MSDEPQDKHNKIQKNLDLQCTPNECTFINKLNSVLLSTLAKKQLKKLPPHIVLSFQNWVEDVETRGLGEVRKIPGYHDEPLKGELKGLRSIRISKAYRAYYRIVDGAVRFIKVERVDKHEY